MREKPQIFDNGINPLRSELDGARWIKSILKSFNQMSEENQKEFLTLHNDFSDLSFQDLSQDGSRTCELHYYRRAIRAIFGPEQDRDKILKIICIFVTNLWMGKPKSVEIHAATCKIQPFLPSEHKDLAHLK